MPQTETLRIEIDSSTNNGVYPFREVLQVLSAWDDMLEKSLEAIYDEKHAELPLRLRPQLVITAQQPKVGSYYQQLEVGIEWAKQLGPVAGTLVSQLTPSQLFEIMKEAVEFMRWFLSKFNSTGTLPQIQAAGNKGTIIIAQDGSKVDVRNVVIHVAEKSELDFFKIAQALSSTNIASAKIIGPSGDLSFGPEDRRFADPKFARQQPVRKLIKRRQEISGHRTTQLQALPDTRVRLVGEITSFDKRRRRGVFHVNTNQDLHPEDYDFEVSQVQALDDVILAMRRSNTTIECLVQRRKNHIILRVVLVEPQQTLQR